MVLGKKKPLPPNCFEFHSRFYCSCMIPFGSKKAVWEHWEDFHAPFTDDSGEEKFPELKVTVHDDPSMLKCSDCDCVFVSRYDFIRHRAVCSTLKFKRTKG